MPDNVEKIVIGIDETDAVQSAKAANKALEQIEKTAGEMGEAAGAGFEKVAQGAKITVIAVDRTAASMNRAVAAFEKKLNFAGLSGIEKTLYEADVLVKKLGKDTEQAARVMAAANKEVARQQSEIAATAKTKQTALVAAAEEAAQRRITDQLKREQDAMEEAAEASRKFAASVAAVNRQSAEAVFRLAEQERALRSEARAATQAALEQARYRTASATGRINIDRQRTLRTAGAGATASELQELNRHFDTLISRQQVSDQIAARNKLAESLRNSAEGANFLATRFLAMGAVVGAAFLWLTKTAASLERTQLAFRNLIGNKQAGDTFFESLIQYSKESVFGLDEIARSGQKALARGFNPQQAERIVKISYATAAAMGLEAEAADRITLALTQMQAKQRVSAEEMNQLAEIGVGGWKALAEYAGNTVPDLMKKAEQGMLDANVAVKVITESGRKFLEMQKQIATGTVSGQVAVLRSELDRTAKELDKDLLPAAKAVLDVVRDLGSALKDVIKSFAALPDWVKLTAAGLAGVTATIAGLTLGIGGAMRAWSLLFAGTSGLVVVGWAAVITAAFAGIIIQVQAMRKAARDFSTEWDRLINGRSLSMEAKYMDSIAKRNAATTESLTKELQNRPFGALVGPKKKTEEELAREREAAARKYAEQVERAQQALEKAQAREIAGIGQISLEYQKLFRSVAGNREAMQIASRAFQMELSNEQKKLADEQSKQMRKFTAEIEDEGQKRLQFQSELYQKQLQMLIDYERQTIEVIRDNLRRQYEMEIEAVEQQRAAKRQQLDVRRTETQIGLLGANPQEVLANRIEFERQAATIEIESARRTHTIKMELIQMEFNARRELLEQEYLASKQTAAEFEAFTARYNALTKGMEQARTGQVKATEDAISKERIDTTKRTNELIIDEYKRQWQQVYDAASGILDQLLTKSRSWGDIMKSILTAAILTPIKQAAATWIANVLTQRPGGAAGGSAGGFSLGGLFGGILGGGRSGPFGAPAGSVIMNAAPGGAVGMGGGTAGLKGLLPGLAAYGRSAGDLLRGLGGLGRSVDILGNKVGSIPGTAGANASGVGGIAGGAMLLGGGALAAAGLYRGGWAGMGMATAGGALIGAKFGGPLGAAIGAGAGAAAGLIRMMFKGAEQKTIEKIKQVYGISIDRPTAKMFMEMAKSSYGGNIDMAIRSPQGREWVELYSMSTGQTPGGMPRPMYGVSYAQSGGQVNLQPVYSQYGQVVSQPYSGPTPSQWSQSPVYVQLDPKQANDLLEGRMIDVMTSNPEVVSNAATSAGLSGVNRSASRISTVEPLTTFA